MKYVKYHALGNDYIVINPKDLNSDLSEKVICSICHRNYGVGSDGILLGPLKSQSCDFKLRIFNPDGSEAERSGNGLRIFARYIVDAKLSKSLSFTVETLGGPVVCEVTSDYKTVKVKMGKVSFESVVIPVKGKAREVIKESIRVAKSEFVFCAAAVGNPHCVVLHDNPTQDIARKYGPEIENADIFPNRTNVQFMKPLDRSNIKIEIWERGAGYTLASGTSSIAAAAVAHKLGFCDSEITVHMPGGKLQIQFDKDFKAIMTGPVTKICEGNISDEIL